MSPEFSRESIRQLAEQMGVSESTVRGWIKRGIGRREDGNPAGRSNPVPPASAPQEPPRREPRSDTGMTPAERRLRSQIAANESWARTEDRAARTQPARDAMRKKFEDQVDPDRKLTPQERHKRAENARKAHYQRMVLKSVQARRKKKGNP